MLEKGREYYVIEKTKVFRIINIRELLDNSYLTYMLFVRDLKGKYKQTALGPLWIILSPIVSTIIFSFLFQTLGNLSSEKVPYFLFTYLGFLIWTVFNRSVNAAANGLRQEISLMSKVYIPRLIPVISGTMSGLVDFFVSFVIMFFFLWFYKISISVNMIFLPLVIILTVFCGWSIGLWFAGPSIKYRDISNVVSYMVSFLLYLSPVIYSSGELLSRIPPKWQILYFMNPFTFFVESFRWCIVGTPVHIGNNVLAAYVFLFILFIGGLISYNKWARTIVDIQ